MWRVSSTCLVLFALLFIICLGSIHSEDKSPSNTDLTSHSNTTQPHSTASNAGRRKVAVIFVVLLLVVVIISLIICAIDNFGDKSGGKTSSAGAAGTGGAPAGSKQVDTSSTVASKSNA